MREFIASKKHETETCPFCQGRIYAGDRVCRERRGYPLMHVSCSEEMNYRNAHATEIGIDFEIEAEMAAIEERELARKQLCLGGTA